MNPNGEKPKSNFPVMPVMAPLAMGGQVGCVTLIIVLLALFGGLALDKVLDTKPLFTIVLLVGSAPLALFLTFWIAMRAVKDLQKTMPTPPSSAGRAKIYDEEDNSE
jgi:O-antigen ligase